MANSFPYPIQSDDNKEWVSSICDYGDEFIASVRRGNVHAVQFHPEKSGGKSFCHVLNSKVETRRINLSFQGEKRDGIEFYLLYYAFDSLVELFVAYVLGNEFCRGWAFCPEKVFVSQVGKYKGSTPQNIVQCISK